jgi:hypothetical protein
MRQFHIECLGVTPGSLEGQTWFCEECKGKQVKKPQARNRNGKSRKAGGTRNGRGAAAAGS